MTDFFVDSACATPTAPYNTWALAANKLINCLTSGAASGVAQAGDTIYVSSTHSESTAITQTYTNNSTAALPINVLSVVKSGVGTANSGLAAGAVVVTTGGTNINFHTSKGTYVYGLFCDGSSGGGACYWGTGAESVWTMEACKFKNGNAVMYLCGVDANRGVTTFINCAIESTSAGFTARLTGRFVWENTDATMTTIFGSTSAILGTAPSSLFSFTQDNGPTIGNVRGVDLSAVSGTLCVASTTREGYMRFDGCKIHASVTLLGSPTNGDYAGPKAELFNCDSGNTNYRFQVEDGMGTTKQETTIVRTSPAGASDGTTTESWKMTSRASVPHFIFPLKSLDISIWNDTSGSAKTITVDIVNDGVTLTDAEAWLEVEYFSSASLPMTSFASDRAADILATPANQASSSNTWTTTGLSSPVKQALAVTITPQQKGEIIVRVCLAKASQTIYINPMAEIT